MSWSFDFTGTPEAVKKSVDEACAKLAVNYKGLPEADDVEMVRQRTASLVDALKLGPEGQANWNGVNVKANGSHYALGEGKIGNANFNLAVMRVCLTLS